MSSTDTDAEPKRADTPPAGSIDDNAMPVSPGAGLARRVLKVGWKLAIAAAVAGLVVYRLHFAPVAVDGAAAATGPIVSEVMGTHDHRARDVFDRTVRNSSPRYTTSACR